MVFGFPGRTSEYLTSDAIRQTKEVINPANIAIREKTLEIMDKHGLSRVAYNAKVNIYRETAQPILLGIEDRKLPEARQQA